MVPAIIYHFNAYLCLRAVGLNPTMGKIFSLCILPFSTHSWQVDWSHTNEIKHDAHPRYIGA